MIDSAEPLYGTLAMIVASAELLPVLLILYFHKRGGHCCCTAVVVKTAYICLGGGKTQAALLVSKCLASITVENRRALTQGSAHNV